MVSTMTPRTGSVPGGSPIAGTGTGIIQCSNVSGVDDLLCDTFPVIIEYLANKLYLIRPSFQNTGAMRINMSGLGLQGWKKPDASDWLAGEASPNLEYLIKDNGLGNFITITPSF